MRHALARAALPGLLALLGCEPLDPAPPAPRPQVTLLSPATDTEVPFNTSFRVRAIAEAPAGELVSMQVVLRGAVSTHRAMPLFGAEQEIEFEVTVPKDALLGPDRVPLDLVLVARSEVDGQTVTSPPAGVTLRAVDRTAPVLTVDSPDALPEAPGGFDLAFPAGTPFRLRLSAEDSIGGVVRLGVLAPAILGGSRARSLPPARTADLDLRFSPPDHADLELEVFAEDVATRTNRASRTLRIRVGNGGDDSRPPVVTLSAPTTVECARTASVTARAVDDGIGLERLSLEIDGRPRIRFARAPEDRAALTITATVAGGRPAGQATALSAQARDVYGRQSAVATATVVSVDTVGPDARLLAEDALVPGETWTATVSLAEACGALGSAALTLTDAAGTSTTVFAPLAGARFEGALALPVPADLCVAGPVLADLVVTDGAGNPTSVRRGPVSALDRAPPSITLSRPASGATVRPGDRIDLQVDLQDTGSGVRSATVTVYRPDGAPFASRAVAFAPSACAPSAAPRLTLSATLPADVRLRSGDALQIEVRALDHAGRAAVRRFALRVADDAPPQVRFLAPDPRVPLRPGRTSSVSVFVADLNHDVAQVDLQVSGPAQVVGPNPRLVGAESATVTFALRPDFSAPLGATVSLVAVATDTASPAVSASATRDLTTCGVPLVSRVEPDLGPVGGDVPVTVYGAGFVPGAWVALGGTGLTEIVVRSSSVATARVPAGPHPAGRVDVEVQNVCGLQLASGRRVGGFRFVAPPTLRLVRPGPGAGTTAGARLFVVAGAAGDGVALTELGARVDALPAAVQPGPAPALTLDAALLVPSTATAATVHTWAVDALGQRTELQRGLPTDGANPFALSVSVPRHLVALGATAPIAVTARGRDDRRRDVTRTATVTSNAPGVVSVSRPGELRALAVGSATLTADLGGLTARIVVRVVDDALYVDPTPLWLSPLRPTGSASVAPATLDVLHLVGGGAIDVSGSAVVRVTPASLAQIRGVQVYGASAGFGQLEVLAAGRRVTRSIIVDPRLDVPANQTVAVPSGQRITGGRIEGAAVAVAVPAASWRLEVDAGGRLQIPLGGALRALGAAGGLDHAGRAGPGGAGGGGPGQPGAGVSGGGSALLDGAGAGGGSEGRGGAGGVRLGSLPAVGGAGGLFGALGGGGGGGIGGGGGSGGAIVLDLRGARLELSGLIDLSGGPGGAGTSTAGAGGGGSGGRLQLRADEVRGGGRVRVAGGPGGASVSGGGGGGGGEVDVTAVISDPFLDIDRAGGLPGAGAPLGVLGEEGGPGAARR